MIDKAELEVVEDCARGGYCFQCFNPPGGQRGKLYFFNGEGPFCSKGCYAKWKDIPVGSLPKGNWKGVLR